MWRFPYLWVPLRVWEHTLGWPSLKGRDPLISIHSHVLIEEKEREVVYGCGGFQIMGSPEIWEYTFGWPSFKGKRSSYFYMLSCSHQSKKKKKAILCLLKISYIHGFSWGLGTPLGGVSSTEPIRTRTSLTTLICSRPNLMGST